MEASKNYEMSADGKEDFWVYIWNCNQFGYSQPKDIVMDKISK